MYFSLPYSAMTSFSMRATAQNFSKFFKIFEKFSKTGRLIYRILTKKIWSKFFDQIFRRAASKLVLWASLRSGTRRYRGQLWPKLTALPRSDQIFDLLRSGQKLLRTISSWSDLIKDQIWSELIALVSSDPRWSNQDLIRSDRSNFASIRSDQATFWSKSAQ